MEWKRKSKQHLQGASADFSLSKKLRSDNKSSEEFEFFLNQLTFEEIIGLKLEISSRLLGGKLHGFPLWHAIPRITREALFLYALSVTNTTIDAANLLGISDNKFLSLKNYYKFNKYFSELQSLRKR